MNAYKGEGLVWLIGAAVCLLAATAGPMSISAVTDGRICAAALLALANQLPLLRLLKCTFLGLLRKEHYIRTRPLPLFAYNACAIILDENDSTRRLFSCLH